MKIKCPACGGEAVQGFGFGVVYCLKECDRPKTEAQKEAVYWSIALFNEKQEEASFTGYRRATIPNPMETKVGQVDFTCTGGCEHIPYFQILGDGKPAHPLEAIFPSITVANGVTLRLSFTAELPE